MLLEPNLDGLTRAAKRDAKALHRKESEARFMGVLQDAIAKKRDFMLSVDNLQRAREIEKRILNKKVSQFNHGNDITNMFSATL